MLGILSGQLAAGEKLPSVRDLARRLKVHGNTVLAVYRDLAKRGWVKAQTGSGVFVRSLQLPAADGGLDALARAWLAEASSLGYTVDDVQAAIARQSRPVNRLVALDTDFEMARIVAAEVSAAIGRPVAAACPGADLAPGTLALVHAGQAAHITGTLGHTPFHIVHLKSMQDVLEGQQRPAFPVLIGVVSRSRSILSWAGTLLSSLGFHPDQVLLRNPQDPDWQDGLSVCHLIAADVVAAPHLPAPFRPVVVRLLTATSLAGVVALVTPQELSQADPSPV